MILIILKIMGPSRVGCAAGGEVLFVKELRKQYDRATRKAIERRSWRVQTTFLISSVLLIVMAGLFLHKGLYAIGQALDEVYDINDVRVIVVLVVDVKLVTPTHSHSTNLPYRIVY